MRPSQEEKLAEARQYFYSYQFRQAYHLYHRAFSTLPFRITQPQLDHMSHYMRTLLELDRLDELKFYLPILERHYEQSGGAQIGYALAYVHYLIGSKTRAQNLFERACQSEDTDLRTKALMMLARLSSNEGDCIRYIGGVTAPPRDPQLAKLLEVWRCILLRYQGQVPGSIARLYRLIASIEPASEWYCLLSAKDALVRGLLHQMDFDGARREIENIGEGEEWRNFRTVVMHIEQLNGVYRQSLSKRTILGTDRSNALQLTHRGQTVGVHQPALRTLVAMFQSSPTVTLRRATHALSVSEAQVTEMLKKFSVKLRQLQLPKDSLDWQGNRVHLVPALRLGGQQ
jgi:hypothetical protein